MNPRLRKLVPSPRLVVATAVTALVASLSLALSTPATISVDGQRVASDVGPVTTPGGAYLPLRAIADAAGAETSFEPRSGAIVVRRGTDVLTMHVGSTAAVRNGKRVTLAHAPFTVAGRTMVAHRDDRPHLRFDGPLRRQARPGRRPHAGRGRRAGRRRRAVSPLPSGFSALAGTNRQCVSP